VSGSAYTQKQHTYPRLSGNTCGDNDDICTLESACEAVIGWEIALDDSRGVDVGQVGGNTWCVDDIEEGELGDGGIGLEEQR
jgi:hypothetical protein